MTLKARLLKSEEKRRSLEEKLVSTMNESIRRHQSEEGCQAGPALMDDSPRNQCIEPHMVDPAIRPGTSISRLSPTEIRIATLVRQGYRTREIAEQMKVTAKTVNMHRFNIRCKLGLGKKGTNLHAFLNALPNE